MRFNAIVWLLCCSVLPCARCSSSASRPLQQVGSSPDLAATPQTLRAQLAKLQAQEEEAERLRAKLVGKVELLREQAAVLRSLDQEKRKLEEQVGWGVVQQGGAFSECGGV
jgi:hypothetical protein